ncbi:DUF4259 domain-containing protein [Streptomyces sp. NPDC058637]
MVTPTEEGAPTGTWGMGHFDSDTAADFAGNLFTRGGVRP